MNGGRVPAIRCRVKTKPCPCFHQTNPMRLFIAFCPALLAAVAAVASAQEPLYKYTDKDGRIVYSDIPPPVDANNVQRKRLGINTIDTSELSYQEQRAQQRNPVTLYGGSCGPICETSRALLNRRGVPFKEIDPSLPAEAQKLRALTGDMAIPVLVVGGAMVLKGFEEQAWQTALDTAGYPKTPPARVTTIRRNADREAAEKLAGKPPGKK